MEPRRIRVGSGPEDGVGTVDERRTFRGIDHLDGLAPIPVLEGDVVGTVHRHRPLAERHLLWWVHTGLHLHHALPGEFLKIVPAQLACHGVRGGEDQARVARMRLYQLARPFGVE